MASQKFAIRLSVEDAEKVRAALKGVGADGASALKVFGEAADRAAARTAGLRAEAQKADPAIAGLDAASRKARAGMDGLGDTVGRVGGSLRTLGLTGGLSGAAVVAAAAAMADAWTRAGNQIAAAGVPVAEVADAQQRLVALALDSRTGLGSTVELYARLTRATSELGVSQDQVFEATEILTKGMKAAGQSTSETQAAVLQLGQALASGVLQGDELRSLRENSPAIAQAIADEFGVTIGQLKELGAEGELTSDRVFKAILNAGDEIRRQFDTTQMTLGDAWTNIGTQATAVIARLDEMYGVTYTWGQALKEVGDTLAEIGGGTPGAPQNFGALAARRQRFEGEIRRLDAMSEPLFDPVDVTRQLTEAETALATRRRAEHVERLAALSAELRILQQQNEEVLNREVERFDPVSDFFGTWWGNEDEIAKIKDGVSNLIDNIRTLETRAERIEALPLQAFVGEEADRRETTAERTAREKHALELDKEAEVIRSRLAGVTGQLAEKQQLLNELVASGRISAMDANAEWEAYRDQLGLVDADMEALRQSAQAAVDAINSMDVALAPVFDVNMATLEDFLRQLGDTTDVLVDENAKARIAEFQENFRDAVKEGFQEGIATGDWGDAFSNMLASLVSGVFDNALEQLANRISGEVAETDWFSYLAQIGGSYIGSGGSTGGGGGGNANTPGSYFAKGGVFTSGIYERETPFRFSTGGAFDRLGVMAEEGPEAVMPLQRTSDGRLGVIATGTGGGAPAKVEVHIHTEGGAQVEQRQSRNADGSERIDVYIKAKALEALQSGQGAKIMRDTYGVSRPATRR